MHNLITAAKTYLLKGISVIATDNTKRALFQWKEYQSRMLTEEEVTTQFSHHKCGGIAVICGKVSGNLEVIDIDCKNDLTNTLYDDIISNIPDDLLHKLLIIKTRSNGYHIYYRCDKIGTNQKLAMRHATEMEQRDTPHLKQVVLIETRAEAGYVLAPPTAGYSAIQPNEIPHLTLDERETILEICRSFSEIVEEVITYPKNTSASYGLKPWDDYNTKADCLSLLEKHGWKKVRHAPPRTYLKRPGKTDSVISADYHHEKNLFKVFTTSSQFEPNKGYSPFGVYVLLEHNGDVKKAAIQLSNDGYGEKVAPLDEKIKKPIRKLRELGYDDKVIKENLIRDHKMTGDQAEAAMKDYDAQAGNVIGTFWDINDKGHIIISRDRLKQFIENELGFAKFLYNDDSSIYRMVRAKEGFVKEMNIEDLCKIIEEYIDSLEPSEPFDFGTTASRLREVVFKGAGTLFSESFMNFMKVKEFDFLKDDYDIAYFPFSNGVITVSGDTINTKSYGEINKVIWKRQVINFDITPDTTFDYNLCEYYKFISLISGMDQEKTEYCMTLIGYLLHKYKDSSRPWSIILAEETDDEQKGGGTGKGIFVKAISYIVNTERVDGKNFKLDKNFAFQRVGLDTKIIAIEDVRRNVDFEGFYSIITEGITVEKKNKDELFIPYSDSPKVIFTTNYTIPSVGIHAKRRQRVFEFSGYFNASHTPIDEFGHKLFDDWDQDEWNRFYNFMFLCVQKYLKNGVKNIENSNKLNRKHIRVSYGEEFLEYYDTLTHNVWHMFGEEYKSFLVANELEKKDFSAKRFKKGLTEAATLFGNKIESKANRQAGNAKEFKIISDVTVEITEEASVREPIF